MQNILLCIVCIGLRWQVHPRF